MQIPAFAGMTIQKKKAAITRGFLTLWHHYFPVTLPFFPHMLFPDFGQTSSGSYSGN